MCVSLKRGLTAYFLIVLFSMTISCPVDEHFRSVYVDVDYYIVNLRQEQILVKNPEQGIVGFFLAPAEVYHFGYHGDTTVPVWRDPKQGDFNSLNLKFDFFAPGPDSCFDEYICTHEFITDLVDNRSFVDTFFVE